jgi:hypothetical protein
MIVNTNVSASWQSGIGEGRAITPPILLWRSVIVRAIMDALDLDIHAWGKQRKKIVQDATSWFDVKDPHFCEVCDYSNFEPFFIVNLFKKLVKANLKQALKHTNLNKFLIQYLCTFHN